MNVLYLLRYYPCLTESFVREELQALAQRDGMRLRVASLGTRADAALVPAADPALLPTWALPRRPRERFLPMRRRSAGEQFLRQHQRPRDAARLPWLRRQLAALPPDAAIDRVHVHFAGEAAELAHALWLDEGLPYTVMVHAVDLFKPRPSVPTVLRHAERVLTVCDHHRAWLAERGLEADLLRCGPRVEAWSALPPPPAGPLRALFVGRNVPKKGLQTLLSAWLPSDPTAHLHLITDHEGDLPPKCTRSPLLPPEGVRAAMAACNLVVLPCEQAPDGDRDGVPLVLMEAIAAGRPVVSCAVAGVPELVGPEVGWLARSGDRAHLRAILDQADEARRRALRPGPAWLRAHRFTLADQVAGLLQIWHSAGIRKPRQGSEKPCVSPDSGS